MVETLSSLKMMKYTRDSNVFENIATEAQAYWLGFLYADCYINEEDGYLILGLGEKDKEHINKFREFLKTDAPYKDKINNNGNNYRFFRLWDRKIIDDLNKLGLYKNKSLTLKSNPEMPQELIIHWIRGLFDGDGSIYPVRNSKNIIHYRINLCGTTDILNFIQQQWKVNRKLDYNQNIPQLVICKKEDVNRILQDMYSNSTIFLDRKKELSTLAIQANLQ